MPFDTMKSSELEIVRAGRTEVLRTKGVVTGGLIVLRDVKVAIAMGDEIRRRLPSGDDEVFDVVDPTFYDVGPFGPHYQVKVRRKGSFPSGTGGNYVFNVSGTNARVNFQSADNSKNSSSNFTLFSDLRRAVEAGVSDQQDRDFLLTKVSELEKTAGNPSDYIEAYKDFMQSAANHVTVVAPFLPALASLLG